MSLESKIEAMSSKYRELRQCQIPVVKQMIIAQLRGLASEINYLMAQHESPSNSKHRRQIEDVLRKCAEIEGQIADQTNKDIGGKPRCRIANSVTQTDLAKIAVHSVMFYEIRSSELKIRPQEYDQVYNRMCNNLEVIKQIELMVHEQGDDLDKVDAYLESTYENVKDANKELTEAQQIQKKSRRMKFKLAVSGFFAGIGYTILGLPGMFMGLFTGHKITG